MNDHSLHSTPKHADPGTLPQPRTTPVQVFHVAPSAGCYRLAGTLTLLSLIAAPGAYGAPGGGSIVGGSGGIAQSGPTTTITQDSPRLAINWNSFSSKAGEAIVFRQPGASAIALNRVVGTGATELSGSLSANGQVFILNPNGVLFGAGATVNAQGLLASTLNIDTASFMQGGKELLLQNAGAAGGITNQGSLTASPGGYVALIAPQVINEGGISAQQGNAWMSAGDKVTLQLGDSGLMSVTVNTGSLNALADNRVTGRISANGGNVNLEAKAAENIGAALVNHDGVIEAQTLNDVSGRVRLMGDMQRGQLTMNGQIDVSAPVSGDGGAVETSAARVKILDGARVHARAREGVNGSWLIDPEDFSIVEGGGQTSSSIGNQTLTDALKGGAVVTLATQGSPGTGGDVFVSAAVKWEGAGKLTLKAHRNIYINADMEAKGDAGLSLWTGQSSDGIGTYFLNNAKINLADTTTFTTRQGLGSELKSYKVITTVGLPSDVNGGTSLQGMRGKENYVLGTDIDAKETRNWNVEQGFRPIRNFGGTLEGLGHSINGLFINYAANTQAGLFATTTSTADIRNIKLVDADVTARVDVGILAGQNLGRISNVSSTGTVTGTVGGGADDGWNIGGLVGRNLGTGNIDGSSSAANVTGTQAVGGLVGWMTDGASVSNSNATGKVTAVKQGDNALLGVGGLVGINIQSTIRNSYAKGNVDAAEMAQVGGLVGQNGGLIENSYAVGNVTGRQTIGGLTGIVILDTGVIKNSYATGSVNAVGDGAVQIGGLVGYAQEKTKVTDSYARGSVNIPGNNPVHVGGLIGYMQGDAEVSNSYASGAMNVTGSNPLSVGGLIGAAEAKAKIVSSYWNTDSIANGGTGIGSKGDSDFGVGRTGKELMATGTFANSGWSISNAGGSTAVWRIYDGVTMPLLRSFMQDLTLGGLTSVYNSEKQSGPLPDAPRLDFTAATGRDAGTYSPSSTQQGYDITGGNLKIVPAPLTVTTENVTKNYDGTPSAVGGGPQVTQGTVYAGDRVVGGTYAFTDVNAGSGNKTVTVRDVRVIDGNDGNNYALTLLNNTTSTINPAPLVVSTRDVIKTYDGTDSALGAAAAVADSRLYKLYKDDSLVGGTFAFTDPNAGAGNKTVTVSNVTVNDGNGGRNYTLVLADNKTSTINPAPLVLGVDDVSKTYDGTVSAAGTVRTLNGRLYNNDALAGGVFTFSDQNAGDNKTVNISSVSVLKPNNDNNTGNYAITYRPNTTSRISRAPFNVIVDQVVKTYDGTNAVSGFPVTIKDRIFGNDSLVSGIASFADRNAGNNKTVTVKDMRIIDGNTRDESSNYDVTIVPNRTSRIDPAALTVGVNDVVKTYDGTLAVAATPIVSGGTLFGDKLADNGLIAFTDRNVGAGNKTVTVSGFTVDDGNGGRNYQVSYAPNRSSTINPAVLTVSAGNVAKTYDGTVDAPGAAAAIVEGRLYAGDSLSGGAFAFADRNAGAGNKTVTVSGITVNDGNGGNNYLLRLSPNMSSTISPAPLTVTANGARKTYDAIPYEGGNGVAIAGLAGDETADVLGGQLGYGGTAQGALLPGSYRITPAGLQSQNYAISYASGTLQIDQPPNLTSRVNLLDPMQRAGARQTPATGAAVQVAGCGVSLPANVLGVDCIAASTQRGR
ncbi:YDG domain-containing protein [Noviherbaspirillum sp. 1P10PC]|uniref:YDG domain-containing protein n=1 Tax=Noviherbaspirillum sp. 1P10PC TaxID=3132292 RepID=UPI0039A0882B